MLIDFIPIVRTLLQLIFEHLYYPIFIFIMQLLQILLTYYQVMILFNYATLALYLPFAHFLYIFYYFLYFLNTQTIWRYFT